MAGRGVTIREQALGAAPIEALNISTIGIVGTAPDAAIEELKKKDIMDKDRVFTKPDGSINYHNPILLTKRTDAMIGENGSLPLALDTIYAQGNATVVMVIVPKTEDRPAAPAVSTMATELVGTVAGIDSKEKYTIAAVNGEESLVLKNDNDNIENFRETYPGRTFTLGSEAAVYTARGRAVDSGGNVRVHVERTDGTVQTAGSVNLAATGQTQIEGYKEDMTAAAGDEDTRSGAYALLDAESVVGRKPRLIGAPGINTGIRFSNPSSPGSFLKNEVATALEIIATRLRGIAYVDGPNTTHAEALAYAADFNTARTYVLDPGGLVNNSDGEIVDVAMSGFALGLTAKTDAQNGWWNAPSNRPILGLQGLKRPIDYSPGDPNSRAVLLNENAVTTVIRYQGGFRLFGVRTTASTDPAFKYISVRRIADNIEDSVQEALFYFIDKNITTNFLRQVVNRANGFLRRMVSLGALIGGECFVDGELNTPDSIAQGKVYFNVRFTPPYPAEEIIFTFNLVNDYLTRITI